MAKLHDLSNTKVTIRGTRTNPKAPLTVYENTRTLTILCLTIRSSILVHHVFRVYLANVFE